MFSGQLPQFLDPRKYADQGRVVEGQLTVADLPRLQEYRESLDQPVEISLAFDRDEEGHRRIKGEVSTTLVLQCQRCLEPVNYPVRAIINVALVWSEDQATALPERLDPWLVGEEPMVLTDLLEEELLLAMPLVALHDPCPTALPQESGEPEKQENADNPFAVLAKLKGQGK
ncbi:MAG: YceD family protein [Pseudomonadales bacterium]|nr:YceD family protein [Pseudomonadales bacterium]